MWAGWITYPHPKEFFYGCQGEKTERLNYFRHLTQLKFFGSIT